ncbi:innate immunity activator protein [Ornithorhynchus anatinus]|uniref:innate immunity activator protein n=1 Tax=Ornithorhynchus anatinus TaxID=9258 RepID=UPI0010A87D87|nr:innate immunity activator protein [Ornithorhynchus anatinus]
MESKDEISDTDSGIILQSGSDSPVSPLKELTRAVRKQQELLEARLEACLQELRKLCMREAELTGTLPQEYPLKPGEKPPKVRRRIGAAYKLDDLAFHREDPLSSLEGALVLQQQITEAARHLYHEENLSKQVRRRRKHAVLQEEKKLQELQRCLSERRPSSGGGPLPAVPLGRVELSASDDSSLSDAVLLEEEEARVPPPEPTVPPASPAPPSRPLPPQELEGLQPVRPESGGSERSPIQNSPWKETSLDHPYEKAKKSSSETSSEASSPATTPQEGPSVPDLCVPEPASYHVVHVRGVPGQLQGRASAPSTPEMTGRRGSVQCLRVDSIRDNPEGRGRSSFPRRRPTHYTVTVPDSCFSSARPPPARPARPSGAEDSGSDVSSLTYVCSAGRGSPDIFLRPGPPPPERPRGPRYCSTLLLPRGHLPAGGYLVLAEGCLPESGWERCLPGPRDPRMDGDGAPVRYQRLVPSHSRIVRTPSLKDCPSAAGRTPSKAAVSEELKWWHERARLRGSRPHSLDRHGAFRNRCFPVGRESLGRGPGPQTQVPTVCVLRRSPDGFPMQVFLPENGEIISQV